MSAILTSSVQKKAPMRVAEVPLSIPFKPPATAAPATAAPAKAAPAKAAPAKTAPADDSDADSCEFSDNDGADDDTAANVVAAVSAMSLAKTPTKKAAVKPPPKKTAVETPKKADVADVADIADVADVADVATIKVSKTPAKPKAKPTAKNVDTVAAVAAVATVDSTNVASKKPPNSYFLFCQDMRAETKKDASQPVLSAAQLGEMWNQLKSDPAKKKDHDEYVEKAASLWKDYIALTKKGEDSV